MDIAALDGETLRSGRSDWFDADIVARLTEHPLDSVETEYPHWVGAVEGPEDPVPPSEQHPVFYGCFDWHSAVHSHWTLVRLLRLADDHTAVDGHPDAGAIEASLDERFTAERVAAEVEHLETNPGFEKPYGWVWLLHLDAELARWDDSRADRWHAALAPLADRVRSLVGDWLDSIDRPFRVGTHGNTAFALHCILDCARSTGDDELAASAAGTARSLFGDDRDYPTAYEPLGWDFLSPALTEADLLRRVYDPPVFADWLDGFLPDVTARPHDAVLEPAIVDPDPDEDAALHLVGLNLARAWALAGIVDGLPEDHRYAAPLAESAAAHAERGLDQAFTDDYAGAHWLSSFALYLLTRNEGGIAASPG